MCCIIWKLYYGYIELLITGLSAEDIIFDSPASGKMSRWVLPTQSPIATHHTAHTSTASTMRSRS